MVKKPEMIKYIIAGTALGLILNNLTIGLGAAFAAYLWMNESYRSKK